MDEIIKKEYESLVKYYEASGGNSHALISKEYASMVINGDKVLAKNSTEGIIIETERIENGVYARITVKRGYKAKNPVHLCFGMLPREGKQIIKSEIVAEEDSAVRFIAHCIFPNALRIEHIMDSRIIVERNAKIEYEETHFHGKSGGVKVIPKTVARVKEGGEYNSSFLLKSGRAGYIDIDYEVHLEKNAKSMLITKIYAREDDEIHTNESIILEGAHSSGVIKTRMALRNRAKSFVIGKTVGLGEYSKGHVDCTEIIMDDAQAEASPIVIGKNPKAKVTHEAAIGSVDKKQLITLMTRGLTEEEAIDVIVSGLLK
ncbi:MAG: SufD family Fe-S cluster assembly protein [Thermoplasmata archaeon]|nr:SufD family Fe-S cluster assembly protein [Thermoplasmata archaeon]